MGRQTRAPLQCGGAAYTVNSSSDVSLVTSLPDGKHERGCRCERRYSARALCRRILHWLARWKRTGKSNKSDNVHHWRLDGGTFGYNCQMVKENTQAVSLVSTTGTDEGYTSSWPSDVTSSRRTDDTSDDAESGFEDDGEEDNCSVPGVREWNIPSVDLKFGETIARGRHKAIYRGRWHGEVLIHTFTPRKDHHLERFLHQVTSLAMIRHENVALFMGACVEPSLLAIVTSTRTGPSICEFIHLRRETSILSDKIHIANQVAQAMGYIHAKGMVHGKLTSRNVFLEGRVQVSLLDHGLSDSRFDRCDSGCLPRGQLTYLSPELMRSLVVSAPHVAASAPTTKHSDTYAFGTLLFELVTSHWPLQGESTHSLIWRVANGKGQSLENIRTPSSIKDLLALCWSFDPIHRPSFPQIVRYLQRSVALHRRYSSSEPERLNRLDQKLVC